jgi:mannose-1-phosphate guanylyltransferase/mannose-6-phosphate isomerase
MRDRINSLADRFDVWLRETALPLWWLKGADLHNGGFYEALGFDGNAPALARRARVQARQVYVYAVAGAIGWDGPWERATRHGLDFLDKYYRRPDRLYRTCAAADGAIVDDTAMLYDQAFILMASAWVYRTQRNSRQGIKQSALNLIARVASDRRHPAGGFREAGEKPFLSNPHMHLLEAALAWIESDNDPIWHDIADEIATLCLNRFVDPKKFVLYEYFDENWRALGAEGERSVEPGHQFEWAWLLERWARLRRRADAHEMACRLFEAGSRGVDEQRNVAVDELDDRFVIRRATARLWPQTERLKAALILSETGAGDAGSYLQQAIEAAESVWGYLQAPLPGLWHDKMLENGGFIDEPAPASSFYHIICAIVSLRESAERIDRETRD